MRASLGGPARSTWSVTGFERRFTKTSSVPFEATPVSSVTTGHDSSAAATVIRVGAGSDGGSAVTSRPPMILATSACSYEGSATRTVAPASRFTCAKTCGRREADEAHHTRGSTRRTAAFGENTASTWSLKSTSYSRSHASQRTLRPTSESERAVSALVRHTGQRSFHRRSSTPARVATRKVWSAVARATLQRRARVKGRMASTSSSGAVRTHARSFPRTPSPTRGSAAMASARRASSASSTGECAPRTIGSVTERIASRPSSTVSARSRPSWSTRSMVSR